MNESKIHSTAVIHPSATLGSRVCVGPYSVIGEGVTIGDDVQIQEHVSIRGNTFVGNKVQIFPFAVVGAEPQHLKYKNEETVTEIGAETVLREYVTVHRGTTLGTGKTQIGKKSYIMAYAHIAHDCEVGSSVIICNGVQLAGHVTVGDYANIGGLTGVVQFCRIGESCYVGGASMIRKDLPPFLMGKGNDFEVQGINSVGLSRQGFSAEVIQELKSLYKIFYLQNLTASQAIEKALTELKQAPEVESFIQFVKTSKLGFVR